MKPQTARVLQRLEKALKYGDGWVCARDLLQPDIGGNRWGARIWELIHEHGYQLQRRWCDCLRCRRAMANARRDGRQPPRLSQWRLTARPASPASSNDHQRSTA